MVYTVWHRTDGLRCYRQARPKGDNYVSYTETRKQLAYHRLYDSPRCGFGRPSALVRRYAVLASSIRLSHSTTLSTGTRVRDMSHPGNGERKRLSAITSSSLR